MTFEPDPLTVPDSAPIPLTSYSLYYTPTGAGEIIGRAVQLLGLDESRVTLRGFETESLMVDELLMQDEGVFPGCFVHGAGDSYLHTHTHTHTYMHTHTTPLTLTLTLTLTHSRCIRAHA